MTCQKWPPSFVFFLKFCPSDRSDLTRASHTHFLLITFVSFQSTKTPRTSILAQLIAKTGWSDASSANSTFMKRMGKDLKAGTLTSNTYTTDVCDQVELMLRKIWSMLWSAFCLLHLQYVLFHGFPWIIMLELVSHRNFFLSIYTWSQGRRKHYL